MDRGLSRLKDILQDITEHQQSSEQDREIADTTLVPYDRTPEACEVQLSLHCLLLRWNVRINLLGMWRFVSHF